MVSLILNYSDSAVVFFNKSILTWYVLSQPNYRTCNTVTSSSSTSSSTTKTSSSITTLSSTSTLAAISLLPLCSQLCFNNVIGQYSSLDAALLIRYVYTAT